MVSDTTNQSGPYLLPTPAVQPHKAQSPLPSSSAPAPSSSMVPPSAPTPSRALPPSCVAPIPRLPAPTSSPRAHGLLCRGCRCTRRPRIWTQAAAAQQQLDAVASNVRNTMPSPNCTRLNIPSCSAVLAGLIYFLLHWSGFQVQESKVPSSENIRGHGLELWIFC